MASSIAPYSEYWGLIDGVSPGLSWGAVKGFHSVFHFFTDWLIIQSLIHPPALFSVGQHIWRFNGELERAPLPYESPHTPERVRSHASVSCFRAGLPRLPVPLIILM